VTPQERELEAFRILDNVIQDVSEDRVIESLDYDTSEEDAMKIYRLVKTARMIPGVEE
jgi:hypothetical protein